MTPAAGPARAALALEVEGFVDGLIARRPGPWSEAEVAVLGRMIAALLRGDFGGFDRRAAELPALGVIVVEGHRSRWSGAAEAACDE